MKRAIKMNHSKKTLQYLPNPYQKKDNNNQTTLDIYIGTRRRPRPSGLADDVVNVQRLPRSVLYFLSLSVPVSLAKGA